MDQQPITEVASFAEGRKQQTIQWEIGQIFLQPNTGGHVVYVTIMSMEATFMALNLATCFIVIFVGEKNP
ncbi:MAG: hypothetical protein FWH55_11785 [Oscillospiraceae bacterium]|nr:hypothetical protein [Oscillospiraceae bacterium]